VRSFGGGVASGRAGPRRAMSPSRPRIGENVSSVTPRTPRPSKKALGSRCVRSPRRARTRMPWDGGTRGRRMPSNDRSPNWWIGPRGQRGAADDDRSVGEADNLLARRALPVDLRRRDRERALPPRRRRRSLPIRDRPVRVLSRSLRRTRSRKTRAGWRCRRGEASRTEASGLRRSSGGPGGSGSPQAVQA
jgi:hypothetical protein